MIKIFLNYSLFKKQICEDSSSSLFSRCFSCGFIKDIRFNMHLSIKRNEYEIQIQERKKYVPWIFLQMLMNKAVYLGDIEIIQQKE